MSKKKKADVIYHPPEDIAPGTIVKSKTEFDVILADPPFSIAQGGSKGAIKHYNLMSLEEIKAMPVEALCKKDAVCFLWTTAAALPYSFGVLNAWGFQYVSIFIWVKLTLGLGDPLRNCAEFCLIGRRGKPERTCKSQQNWDVFPVQWHSKKPEEMYAVIERLYANNQDRLELFARDRPSNPNWYIWGNEAEGGSDIYLPGYPVPEYSDRVTFIPPTDPAAAMAVPAAEAVPTEPPELKEAA